LVESEDPKVILKVKENLKLNDDEYVPVICGSVVNGGFKRKL